MGNTKDLETFLRAKALAAQGEPEPEIDWAARKSRWLSDVASLYGRVKSWLTPLERDGVLKYHISSITLEEEPIGPYPIDVLTILIGRQKVSFYPKGTLIVGCQGRVDIRGPQGIRSLILADGKWSLVEQAPRLRLVPFNQDSFQDILSEVME